MGKLSPLAGVAATREVLERHGLSTKKELGQNFLINDDILAKIVDLAQLGPSDRVLEVGPGIGTLTIALLKSAACVVSVERDTDLPAVLEETCAPWADRFRLINKDALDVSAEEIATAMLQVAPSEAGQGCGALWGDGGSSQGGEGEGAAAAFDPSFPNKFVANLPYAVAATVVLGFFQQFPLLESATVMVQKEVADRMAAKPGTKNYGAYTVKLGMYAQPVGRFLVSPGNFFPPPHVDSAVIRLDRRDPAALVTTAQERGVKLEDLRRASCIMADAAFATRRKTLSNSCRTYFASRGEEGKRVVEALPELFERAGVDPKRRGEALSQDEFIALGASYLAVSCS